MTPTTESGKAAAANNIAMSLYVMAWTWWIPHFSLRTELDHLMYGEYPFAFRFFQSVLPILNHVDAALLIAAAIGELRKRPWARYVTLGCAAYSILFAVVSIYFECVAVTAWVEDASQIIRDSFDRESMRMMGRMEAFSQSLPSVVAVIVAFVDGVAVFAYHRKSRRKPIS